jgi:WD40 repeat protein/pSer/pThr/pTyr-binding forkhead associated (FHA) protein
MSKQSDPYLLVSTTTGNRKFLLSSGNSWTIGRDSSNNLIITEPWISRNHAIIQKIKEQQFRLTDLGSSNGSYVKGKRINGSIILQNQAQIFLGRTKLEFHSPLIVNPSEVNTSKEKETSTSMFHKRHLLSVIVVELCDIDLLGNRLDDNIFSMVIDDWFAQARSILSHRGIVVNKSLGNSLIGICFHEQEEPKIEELFQIFQALFAIYNLTSELINKYFLAFPLRIRAAINTGNAMVKTNKYYSKKDHDICGDIIEDSFSLKSISKMLDEDVILGEKTYAYSSQILSLKNILKITNNPVNYAGNDRFFYTADFDELIKAFQEIIALKQVKINNQNVEKNQVNKYPPKEAKVKLAKDCLEEPERDSLPEEDNYWGGRKVQIFKGHPYWITTICFNPKDQTFATSSWDHQVKLWNLRQKELQTFEHNDIVNHVCFSPDGQILATASWDKTAKLWSLDGQEIQTLQHKDVVNSVCFSPDGKTIATTSFDQSIKIFSVQGENLQTILGHEASVLKVSFSPDGQTIASTSIDGSIKLWNLKGQLIKTILGHEASVVSLSFSPDGQTLVTGSWDKTAKLWSLKGKQIQVFQHEDVVNTACFSSDGQIIATASKDKTIKFWSMDSKLLHIFKHNDIVNSISFSLDDKIVVACDCCGRVILIDIAEFLLSACYNNDKIRAEH